MLRNVLTGLMCSLILVTSAVAAPVATREVLNSEILGEDRPLNIVLPAGYSPDKTYSVAYVLDGGHRILPNMAEGMQSAHEELIVVGVENVDRSRDMFPDPMPDRENRGGGGENFLTFLTKELIPYIEGKYATNGYRVISGQSNSGFFVLYALLNAPDSFDAYLAGSPMIGWDREMIHDGTKALLAGTKSFPRTLFMNRGEDEYAQVTDYMPAYEALLNEVAPVDFRWKSEFIEGGTHVPASTYRNGIAFIFGEGQP